MMMGMDEDPEDHAAVASSIFIAVAVYAVRLLLKNGGFDIDPGRRFSHFADSRPSCMSGPVEEALYHSKPHRTVRHENRFGGPWAYPWRLFGRGIRLDASSTWSVCV